MALTVATYLGPVGPPADLGVNGYERVRITGDATGGAITITPPANLASGVKTVLAVIGCGSNVPLGGVAIDGVNQIILTGVGWTVASGAFIDILLWGKGR
jgi:hypothetical protein